MRRQYRAADDGSGTIAGYGNGTSYVRDDLGRVNVQTQQLAAGQDAQTWFTYDVFGHRTTLTDPDDNFTSLMVDDLGRTTQEITTLGTRHYDYDAFGSLLSSTDRNNRTITYGYDNLGRRVREDWSSSSYAADYTYTVLGQLEEAKDSDASGTISEFDYLYDPLGRMTHETQQLAPLGTQAIDFAYEHDLVGNVKQLTADFDGTINDFVNNYNYDNRSRVTKVMQSGGSNVNPKTVTFDHEYRTSASGAPILTTFIRRRDTAGPGTVVASTKQNDYGSGGVSMIHHYQGDLPASTVQPPMTNEVLAQTIEKATLVYDPRGLVAGKWTSEYDAENPGTPLTTSVVYAYDNFGQMTTATTTKPNEDPHTETFDYDDAGNRNEGTVVEAFNRVTADPMGMYGYDAEGNLTERWSHGGTVTSTDTQETAARDWAVGLYFVKLENLRFDDDSDYDNAEEAEGVTVSFTLGGQPVTLLGNPLPIEFTHDTSGWDHFDGEPGSFYIFKVTQPVTNATLEIHYQYVHPNLQNEPVDWEEGLMKVQDAVYEAFAWDRRRRLVSVARYNGSGTHPVTMPGGGTVNMDEISTKHYEYDVFDRLTYEYNVPDSSQATVKEDEKVYVHERGRRILEYEKPGSAFEVSQRMVPDPTANRMLAEERIEGTGNVTIWPLHDQQGTVAAAFADDWFTGMDEVQRFDYDAFGRPQFDATQDPSLANRLTMLHAGRDYDTDTKLYYNGRTWNDPATGRFLHENPATGDVNPYRYAGNSPANLPQRGRADASWIDYFGEEFGYYVKPWNNQGSAGPDWLWGVGKGLGWAAFVVGTGGAGYLGGGALMGAIATAVGKITLGGTATYTGVQAGISVAETTVEYAMASAFGADDFSFAESLGKNFAINFVTGGIGSKGKWLHRAGAWAGRQAIEIAGDTTYDVYQGRNVVTSLAMNTAGSIGGEAIFKGIGWGISKGLRRSAGNVAPSGVVKAKSGVDLGGAGRYKRPQAWIDRIVDEDVANVRLSHPPRYSGRLRDYGQATLDTPGMPGSGRTTIGRPSLRSRKEMIDTIIHEETHHRLWARFLRGSKRAENLIDDIDIEEAYCEAVARRFLRMKGLISD